MKKNKISSVKDIFKTDGNLEISFEEIKDISAWVQSFYSERSLFEEIPCDGIGYIISDIHGNFKALSKIMEITDFFQRAKKEKISLIFLGDYVDKGKNSLLVLYTVLRLKMEFPENIILLRGNHETSFLLNRVMSFKKEIRKKYDSKTAKRIIDIFEETFDYLPIIAASDNGIIAMHGGPPKSLTLYGLTRIGLYEILWSDVKKGRTKKSRKSFWRLGKGHKINIYEVDKFLENIGMKFLFRGHSHTMKGIEIVGENIMTVISANSLERFGNIFGKRGQSGFVEIDLNQELNSVSQVKTIFFNQG